MDETCPVCEQAFAPGEPRCPRCGWELESDYVLGRLTPELEAAYQERLAWVRRWWQERQQREATQRELAVTQASLERLELQLEQTQRELTTARVELECLRKEGLEHFMRATSELKSEIVSLREQLTNLTPATNRQPETRATPAPIPKISPFGESGGAGEKPATTPASDTEVQTLIARLTKQAADTAKKGAASNAAKMLDKYRAGMDPVEFVKQAKIILR